MSLDIPSTKEVDGSGMRFAVIASRYNEALVDSLVRHACATIEAAGAATPIISHVPGAAELPFAAATLANHSDFDAIIVLGVVIAGDTNHHETIGDSTATALLDLSIARKVPVINGILVVNNLAQAEARAGEEINRGKEFARAALEMAQFTKQWKTKKNQ
ncbi:MAG: 6,7-dimethyl-8-ribityllumazine synthase [Lentimonas sp.]